MSKGMGQVMEIDRAAIQMSRAWFNFISPFVSDKDVTNFQKTPNLPKRTTLERLVYRQRMPSYINDNGDYSVAQEWRTEPEVVISAFFADRLSRTGEDMRYINRDIGIPNSPKEPLTADQEQERAKQLVWHGIPRVRMAYKNQSVPPEGQSLFEISMQAVFTGYVMYPTNQFDRSSIVLLLLRSVLALLHTGLSL